MNQVPIPVRAPDGSGGGGRRATRILSGISEALVLVLVVAAPWAYGAVQPRAEFVLDLGIVALAVLWAARLILVGQLPRPTPVAVCLAAMILIGVLQIVPMPRGLLEWVSPATARMYDQLLPETPEVVPGANTSADPKSPAGSTLSLYPGATRRQVHRLLGVAILFLVVADSIASAASLRRLGLVALINGVALSLFGLVQSFSSDNPRLLFWSVETAGQVFGPFVNRNHFAFYVNLCAGLALGCLLARAGGLGTGSRPSGADRRGDWWRPAFDLLRDPGSLGIILGLALMAIAVVFSLSRGGFLAFLGGAVLAVVVCYRHSRQTLRGGPILLGVAVVAALATWFGYEPVADRLETLRGSAVLEEGRMAVVRRSLPLVRDFPVWGTGLGTFEFVDRLHRTDAREADVFYEHAHDDYLEVLVEGGLVLLLPAMLALGSLLRSGFVASGQMQSRSTQGLIVGALVAYGTSVVHGFTDFNLHIPANALMVTVIAAQIAALGRPTGVPAAGRRWLAPGLCAAAVAGLGITVVAEAWRRDEVGWHLDQATFSGEVFDAASRRRKVVNLEAAARLVSDDARIRGALAAGYFEAYTQHVAEQSGDPSERDLHAPGDAYLLPAMRQLVLARDLCPLRVASHMDLAVHAVQFTRADPPAVYRDRAKRLDPSNPEIWYRSGVAELASGSGDRAWADWRRSLELSDRRLPEILDEALPKLGPIELVRLVLPSDPGRLMAAAEYLQASPDSTRRPILEAARIQMDKRPASSAEDQHLRAMIGRALGRKDEAAAALRSALAADPLNHDWRLELAEALRDQGRFEDSRQELLTILGLQPDHDAARTLLDEVTRQVAEGK